MADQLLVVTAGPERMGQAVRFEWLGLKFFNSVHFFGQKSKNITQNIKRRSACLCSADSSPCRFCKRFAYLSDTRCPSGSLPSAVRRAGHSDSSARLVSHPSVRRDRGHLRVNDALGFLTWVDVFIQEEPCWGPCS